MPKDADVKAWLELSVNHLCPGDANEKLRGYLKTSCEKTWKMRGELAMRRKEALTGEASERLRGSCGRSTTAGPTPSR